MACETAPMENPTEPPLAARARLPFRERPGYQPDSIYTKLLQLHHRLTSPISVSLHVYSNLL